jgi:hypothetical protein
MPSPLFQNASRELRTQLESGFLHTDFGRLLDEASRASRGGNASRARKAFSRIGRMSSSSIIQQLGGAGFRNVIREIERYSKGPTSSILRTFLESLGPTGRLLSSLAGVTGGKAASSRGIDRSLRAATSLIRAFGGEVMPGSEQVWKAADVFRGLQSIIETLEKRGYQIIPPGHTMNLGGRAKAREEQPEFDARGRQRRTMDVSLARGGRRRVASNHPLITGEFVSTPNSSNVHSFGYDMDTGYLYVRFNAESGGPGSLYRYSGVAPEEFLTLYAVRSGGGGKKSHRYGPGEWVWDHLRIRETKSGHRKDYALVGIMNGYVPRKATVLGQGRGQVEEWYITRTVRTAEGKWLQSNLDPGPAWRPLGPRGPGGPVSPMGPRGARG